METKLENKDNKDNKEDKNKENKDNKTDKKNIKIISWNVNGLQGILKKDANGEKQCRQIINNALYTVIRREEPDIMCLQEIRCSSKFQYKPLPTSGLKYVYANYSETKKGYSGTWIASKIKPISVQYDIDGIKEKEGRVITLEFDDFYLVNVYCPNSGHGKGRLNYRINTWEPALRNHIKLLSGIPLTVTLATGISLPITLPATLPTRATEIHKDNKDNKETKDNKEVEKKSECKTPKPVILIGDLNCVPEDIDINLNRFSDNDYKESNDSKDSDDSNDSKSSTSLSTMSGKRKFKLSYSRFNDTIAGTFQEEKKCFFNLLKDANLIDTFRYLNPTKRKYSWGSMRMRSNGEGCRLDFCLISNSLISRAKSADILNYTGSDHIPIVFELN